MAQKNPFQYFYQFQFDNDEIKEYLVELDPDSLSLITTTAPDRLPYWTHLAYKQCRNCPLSPNSTPHCPIAANIMDLVEKFASIFSYRTCTVTCRTSDRSFLKKTSVMEGLSAIFGVIMATSDCPLMEFLKPMARFHLPFATVEETTVRTASMFLLAQYLKYKNQPEMKFEFKALENHYSQVKLVNEGVLERITSVGCQDADKNAIITLHSLSHFLSMEIDCSLSGLESIFTGRY